MKRIFKGAAVVLAVFLLIYFVPYPHRIKADMPARVPGDEEQYTFSINARRHNYLLKNDTIIPEIKIWKGDEAVFSFEDIDYSMYESSILIENVPVEADISQVLFSYYDEYENEFKTASLVFSEENNIYVIMTGDFTYFAPAENSEDIEKIRSFFKNNNYTVLE